MVIPKIMMRRGPRLPLFEKKRQEAFAEVFWREVIEPEKLKRGNVLFR